MNRLRCRQVLYICFEQVMKCCSYDDWNRLFSSVRTINCYEIYVFILILIYCINEPFQLDFYIIKHSWYVRVIFTSS